MRHHLSTHRDNSLLFQFIMVEFIRCCQTLEEAQQLMTLLFADRKGQTFSDLKERVTALVGNDHYQQLPVWTREESHFNKLIQHCFYFNHEEKNLSDQLCRHSEYAFHHLLIAQEKLNGVYALEDVEIELENGARGMRRFKKVIPEITATFSYNENVLYFFLRHHAELDQQCGNGWTAKLFKRLFSGGIEEMQALISNRYRRRGFGTEAMHIEMHVNEMIAS